MNVKLKHLCLLCFLIPVVTVIVSFIWSANLNLISWCIPNIEGCTSISRAGRYEPVKYFFKTMMFIYAVILYFFWNNFYDFLIQNRINLSKFSLLLAYSSIFFLILYIIFLGEGKFYKFFRQIGIFIYIFFTIVVQLFFSFKFKKIYSINLIRRNLLFYYSFIITILGLILFPLVISEIITITNFKNIVSWNYFFLIQIYFLILFKIMRKLDNPTTP